MALNKKIVAHIAKLARLEVTESDLDVMSKELFEILSWIEQLEEVVRTDGPKNTIQDFVRFGICGQVFLGPGRSL